MKNKILPDYISWSNTLPLVRRKNISITSLRQFMGLPDLSDTDNNSIIMYNEILENESSYFARHMGSNERSMQYGWKNEKKSTPCLGSEYGF